MPTIACPSADQLAAFQSGKLDRAALEQVAAHLETCATCQTALQNGSTVSDSLIRELKRPADADAYTDESGCGHAVAGIEALANTDGTQTRDETADDQPHIAGPMPRRLGKYKLLEPIGQGGMGTVYKAVHTLLKRTVAVKVLPPNRLKDPHAVNRFRREIEAAGRLDHPNIVRTSDADEADGQHFLVMEWLPGQDLAKKVREFGPLAIDDACDFIHQAALGLQCAHEHGMVHRDVKPSNLFLTSRERDRPGDVPVVKVLDLGLALLHGNVTESELTSDGQVMGTYDFIAPEQAMESHAVDARADIYSLGCTFYFLLTGRTPFQGKSESKKLLAHQLEEPTPIASHRAGVPTEVVGIVKKMMAKDPVGRHASMRDVAEAIDKVTRRNGAKVTESASKPVTLSPCHPVTPSSRRKSMIAAFMVLGLAAVIALVFGIIRITTPEGDFVIDTDDPEIKFSVSKGVVTLHDRTRTYQVEAVRKATGEYELNVKDNGAGLSFKTDKLTIKRGQKLALEMKFERKQAAIAKSVPDDDGWLKLVAAMPAEKQVDAVAAKLRQINTGFIGSVENGEVKFKMEGNVVTAIELSTDNVSDISPVRALAGLQILNCGGTQGKGKLADLTPLQHMKLSELICPHTQVSDLTPLKETGLTVLDCEGTKVTSLAALKGLKLTILYCSHTSVSDLSPLTDMKLIYLTCDETPVKDLSPLRNMRLTYLRFSETGVSELSPLKEMKLLSLGCTGTKVTDLAVLKGMPLTDLSCDLEVAGRNAELLRSITTLKTINGKPTAELLKDLDKITPPVGEIRRYLGHKGGVGCVAFNPDGKSFLSGSNGELWLWDVDKTNERLRFPNTYSFVQRAVWSPDGERVIGSPQTDAIAVWELMPKVQEVTRVKIQGAPECLMISPDRPHVIYTTRSGGRIYALDKKAELPLRFIGEKASLSKDGRRLLTGDSKTLYLWDVDTGKEVSNVELPGYLFHLALSPDGRTALASGGANVYQWDMVDKKEGKRLDGTGRVQAIAISPDGKRALTGGFDKKIRLWDLATGVEVYCFDGHTGPVNSVAFSPNGQQAISGSEDKTIRLWQLPAVEVKVEPAKDKVEVGEIRRYIGHKQEVRCVAWAPDGKSFFTGSFGEPWLWDVESSLERKRLVGLQGWVHGGAFSHDGAKVIAGGQGGVLVMWEAKSGKKLHDILSFKVGGPVENVVCSPDQPHLFFSDRGGVRVFDLDKKQDDPRRFQGERIRLSPDGRRLLTCDGKTLYLWDAATGKELSSVQHTGHIISLALAPDGRNAAVSVGSVVTMWDMEAKKMGKRIDVPSKVQAIAILPDGKRILTGGTDGKLRLWSLETAKELHCFDGHTAPVLCIAIAPDGRRVLTGSEDKSARLWQLPAENQAAAPRVLAPLATSAELSGPVSQVSVSRDGTRMVAYSGDMVLAYWELDPDMSAFKAGWKNKVPMIQGLALEPAGGKALLAIGGSSNLFEIDAQTGDMNERRKGRHDGANRLLFSTDGRRYLVADFYGGIGLRDTQEGEVLRKFQGHTGGNIARIAPLVCFSRDGERILSSGGDHTVRLWDATNADELKKLSFAGTKKRFIALSPDGKQALISQDNDVQVWDLTTGKPVGELKGHKDHVTAVAYGPDGAWAVSASQDKTLRVWDVATGRELAKLDGHSDDVTCVAVAAQGQVIISGSRDKTLRAWKWTE